MDFSSADQKGWSQRLRHRDKLQKPDGFIHEDDEYTSARSAIHSLPYNSPPIDLQSPNLNARNSESSTEGEVERPTSQSLGWTDIEIEMIPTIYKFVVLSNPTEAYFELDSSLLATTRAPRRVYLEKQT